MVYMSKLTKRLAMARPALLGLVLLAACGEQTTTTAAEDVVQEVRVLPESASLNAGRTIRLSAEVRDSRGRSVPEPISWTSSDTTVATVDATGLVLAVSSGEAQLTGRSRGKAGRSTVTVTPVAVASVVVTPGTANLLLGAQLQFVAAMLSATDSALTDRSVTWASSNPAIASVSQSGIVTVLAAGRVTVSATSEAIAGFATVDASLPPVGTVTTLAATASDAASATLRFTEVSDGTGAPARYMVRYAAGTLSWGSAIPVASGTCTGPIAGTSVGAVRTCTVTGLSSATAYQFQMVAFRGDLSNATYGQLSNMVSRSTTAVAAAPVATITLAPVTASASVGGISSFTATLRDAAGNTLTGRSVVWSSTSTAVATVSTSGVATAVAAGTTSIRATSEGVNGQATLIVSAPAPLPVASVVVGPATTSLTTGASAQLTVTLRDAAGNALTGRVVTWSTTNTAVATVSATGLVSAIGEGTATVRATSDGVTGQVAVTVAAPGALVFAMNYSAAAAPLAGWSGMRADNADHTMTRVAGIGPMGQNGYRMMMDVTSPTGGDNYWGHGGVFTGAPFAYGDRVYFRWRFRWLPGTDCRAYEQGGTGLESGVWRNKILIVNDASSSLTSRFIIQLECLGFLSTGGAPRFYLRLMKGGGVDPVSTPDFALSSEWVDVQVEMQYSSAEGVADGAYRIWINSNTRATPTAQATNIRLHADVSPGYVQFGAYFNNALFPGGLVGWEHVDFQIDDDFDFGWDIP